MSTGGGGYRFTTARVAEVAGISVGSLYQYFPNKEAILFRLQADEWQQTMGELGRILGDASVAPIERLRAAVRMFFRSECDEAAFRSALEEAAPLYREPPESRAHNEEGRLLMESFMKAALPGASVRERAFAAVLDGQSDLQPEPLPRRSRRARGGDRRDALCLLKDSRSYQECAPPRARTSKDSGRRYRVTGVGSGAHSVDDQVDLSSIVPRVYLLTRMLLDFGRNPSLR